MLSTKKVKLIQTEKEDFGKNFKGKPWKKQRQVLIVVPSVTNHGQMKSDQIKNSVKTF